MPRCRNMDTLLITCRVCKRRKRQALGKLIVCHSCEQKRRFAEKYLADFKTKTHQGFSFVDEVLLAL